ncbi:MAG: hypothetical protein WCL16_08025 [bacterium]
MNSERGILFDYRSLLSLSLLGLFGLNAFSAPPVPDAESFQLRDYLGRSWENESVTFPLTKGQLAQARAGHALAGTNNAPIAYQLVPDQSEAGYSLEFLADLAPFGTQCYMFTPEKKAVSSDLGVEETADRIVVSNRLIGIAIPKSLKDGGGPIGSIRMKSGRWVGGSQLKSDLMVTGYTATVTACGPVFVEVACKALFVNQSSWELRVRLNAGEPVVLLDERSAVQGGRSLFQLFLDTGFKPNQILYRDGSNNQYDHSRVADIREGPVFYLEPWLHWAQRANQGPCFSVFHSPDAGVPEVPGLELEKGAARKAGPGDPPSEVLSVAAGFAGLWVDPSLSPEKPQAPPQLVLTKDSGGLHLDFPLKNGRRNWMISALEAERGLEKIMLYGTTSNYPAASLPYRYLIKHGHFPLNRVKDYRLSWNSDADRFPHLLFTREDADRFNAQVTNQAAYSVTKVDEKIRLNQFTMGGPIKAFYATGDAKLGKVIANSAVAATQEAVDWLVKQEGIPFGAAPHHAQVIGDAMILADTALGSGCLAPGQRERLLAQAAFLAYTISRSDYWSPARGYSANPNMTTSVNGYLMAAACLASSHPLAKTWAEAALKELKDEELDGWSDDNGGWLEAPHYAMVSYDQILGALIMAHNSGISDALFTDPKVKTVIDWFGKISTPPDSRYMGFRHLPPIGNTYMIEPTGEFGVLAYLFKDRDPEFAARMQWLYRQQKCWFIPGVGGGYPALAGYRDLLLDPSVPEKAPAWKSELSPKTMAILRNGFPSNRETMLLLLAGGFGGWRSHWDNDSGSITLWGKGRILADDFGYYNPAQADHNMVESPALTGSIMNISRFEPQDALDYVDGLRGGWRRQIAFVKDADPLAPNYYVMCDSFSTPSPATWRLWVTARDVVRGGQSPQELAAEKRVAEDAGEAEAIKRLLLAAVANEPLPAETKETGVVPGAVTRVLRTQQVMAVGKEDVSMDLFFAQPGKLELAVEEKTRTSACGVRPDGSYQGAVTSTQIGIIASLKGATGVTAVLYPRLTTEPAPTFTAIAGGNGIKVQSAAGTDYVFLSPDTITFQEDAVAFTGTVGAIQTRGGKIVLSLGAAGSIAFKDRQLSADKAQSRQWGSP